MSYRKNSKYPTDVIIKLVYIAHQLTGLIMNNKEQVIAIKSGEVLVFNIGGSVVRIKFRVKTLNAVTFKIEAPNNIRINRLESNKDGDNI